MFQLRFNQVFLGLMALSFLSAFVIPQKYSDRVRNIQGIFAPISRPAGAIASAIRSRIAPEVSLADRRREADIRAENDALKVEIASLAAQLEAMSRLDSQRELVGPVRQMCTPVPVVGSDPQASRDSLSLEPSRSGNLKKDMAVVYEGGMVGRIDRTGILGAQVQLVTDRSFKATAYFARLEQRPDTKYVAVRVPTETPLVEGMGKGAMVVRNLNLKDAKAALKVGDWAMLDDGDYPIALTSMRLGQILSIGARSDAPLMAEVRLAPLRNLKQLREVLVVTKE